MWSTKRLGRPLMAAEKVEQIRQALAAGHGIRATAREMGASTTSVMRIAQAITAETERADPVTT